MQGNYENQYLVYEEDDTTESTEKMFASDAGGKFEIVLDVVKTNTSLTIGGTK